MAPRDSSCRVPPRTAANANANSLAGGSAYSYGPPVLRGKNVLNIVCAGWPPLTSGSYYRHCGKRNYAHTKRCDKLSKVTGHRDTGGRGRSGVSGKSDPPKSRGQYALGRLPRLLRTTSIFS
jgi:hypothetical protein